jgi:hypothetical protein
MFANVCWRGMFKTKCIVLPSILNVILPIDVTNYYYFWLSLIIGLDNIIVIILALLILKKNIY